MTRLGPGGMLMGMGNKQPTNLVLDRWQVSKLRDLAKLRGMTMSAVARELLAAQLEQEDRRLERQRAGLARICGIGRGDGTSGADHDRSIYRVRNRRG